MKIYREKAINLNMHLINLEHMDTKKLFLLFEETWILKNERHKTNNKLANRLSDKVLANVFFEPSTRTSLSFEVAMKKLGGNVIYFQKDVSSMKKGESIYDTMKTIECYSDIIVLRHPDKNVIHTLKDVIKKPIINGGNGAGEHPSQALLDLYTIHEHFDIFAPVEKIKILFVGDIKHSRTIHSLYSLLNIFSCFDIFFYPYPDCENEYIQKDNISDFSNIDKFDVVYCTRLQKERFENNKLDIDKYILNKKIVSKMKKKAIILHPLPRNDEINKDVDEDEHACYFEQMENGIYLRMALLRRMLRFAEL